jgi:hypothetical protein
MVTTPRGKGLRSSLQANIRSQASPRERVALQVSADNEHRNNVAHAIDLGLTLACSIVENIGKRMQK